MIIVTELMYHYYNFWFFDALFEEHQFFSVLFFFQFIPISNYIQDASF